MEDRIPLAMEYWERNDPEYCDGNGAESFSSFIDRVTDFRNGLNNRPEKFIVVFSHYQFIAAHHWLNGNRQKANTANDMADFRQYLFSCRFENASILKHEIQGGKGKVIFLDGQL